MIRFEVPLTAQQYVKLGQVANEVGVNRRDLARLAIARLIAHPERLTGAPMEARPAISETVA